MALVDTTATKAALEQRDPPEAQQRSFNSGAIATLKADPANLYERDPQHVPTPWERFVEWLRSLLNNTLGTAPASWFMRNLWVILIIVAAVILAFTLRRRLFTGAFSKAPARRAEVSELHAEVQAEDLDERIRAAEAEGAWRKALRLHYLRALRKLADTGHITLGPQSTDRDYLLQVKDVQVRPVFEHLAGTFQWVWYGEADLDRIRYDKLIADFHRFDPPART